MGRDNQRAESIRNRHDFIGMDEGDFQTIQGLREILINALPEALDALYGRIRKTPEVNSFFLLNRKLIKQKKRNLLIGKHFWTPALIALT